MTTAELQAYVSEHERRFRERTPPVHVDQVLTEYRVTRSEMFAWFERTFGRALTVTEYADAHGTPETRKMWLRLRRAFPDERWPTKTGRRQTLPGHVRPYRLCMWCGRAGGTAATLYHRWLTEAGVTLKVPESRYIHGEGLTPGKRTMCIVEARDALQRAKERR